MQQLINCGVMEVSLTGGEPLVRKNFMVIVDALLAGGIPNAGRIVKDAFLCCKEKGFPTGAEMYIHNGNKHLLRETVNRLAERGCRSLKTNPISNVGAWKEGGYGESISMQELYQLYFDYIPHYDEDGIWPSAASSRAAGRRKSRS